MKMNKMSWLVFVAAGFILGLVSSARAQTSAPALLNVQGRIVIGGLSYNGTGQFQFALVNAGGTVTYWSNDGTGSAGSEPSATISLTLTNGLYSLLLGDTTVSGMTQALDPDIFTNSAVYLRVWFNDGTHRTEQLSPDQRIASVGYALAANTANSLTGTLSSNQIPANVATTNYLAVNYYPLASNPSNYLTSASVGSAVSSQITAATNALVASINTTISDATNGLAASVTTTINSATNDLAAAIAANYVSTNYAATNFYPLASNPGNYLTATSVGSAVSSQIAAATNVLGNSLNTTINNATNGLAAAIAGTYYLNSNPSNYVSSNYLAMSYVSTNYAATNFYPLTSNPSNYLTSATFATTAGTNYLTASRVTNSFYPLSSNPSNYLTSANPAFTALSGQVTTNTANIALNALNIAASSNNLVVLSNTVAAGTPNATPNTLVSRDATASFAATNITLNGVLNLPATAGSNIGVINQGGISLISAYGRQNFFAGLGAANFSLTGGNNVGVGYNTLDTLTSGSYNVALGASALMNNGGGSFNIGIGAQALQYTTNASQNIAIGWSAMANSSANVGTANAATNLAYNVALGSYAGANLSGNANGNILIGYLAGYSLGSANANIDIGNLGTANDSGVIRIGTQPTQNSTYIAGISSNTNLGTIVGPVYVDTNGQLGVGNSSVSSGLQPWVVYAGSSATTVSSAAYFSPNGSSGSATATPNSQQIPVTRTLTLKNLFFSIPFATTGTIRLNLVTNGVIVSNFAVTNTSTGSGSTLMGNVQSNTVNSVTVQAGSSIGVCATVMSGSVSAYVSWSFEGY